LTAQRDVIASRLPPTQRAAIISAARSLIDTPFLHQGRDPNVGLDCQGFIHAVCAAIGYQLSDWPNTHRHYGDDNLLRTALETDFIRLPTPDSRPLDVAVSGDLLMIELPRRRNLHVGVMAEGRHFAEFIHSVAFDGRGAVKADRLSRWKVVAAYTWNLERFERPASPLLTAH
jgi:cell wall-associated NlpC family hydrolase